MTTKYPGGADITKGPAANGGGGWGTDIGLYSCPPNSTNDAEDCATAPTYGMLYQWSAAMNRSTTDGAQGLCPSGWHVPTDAQLKTLVESQATGGCEASTGWQCPSASTKLATSSNWTASPLNTATSTSGFSVQPSGFRLTSSYYGYRTSYAILWSSTADDISYVWRRYLDSSIASVNRNVGLKALGFSVRCLKD